MYLPFHTIPITSSPNPENSSLTFLLAIVVFQNDSPVPMSDPSSLFGGEPMVQRRRTRTNLDIAQVSLVVSDFKKLKSLFREQR